MLIQKKLVRLAKNGVSHEYIGPLILEKIQMYILIRAELLYTLCHEIPCSSIFCKTQKARHSVKILMSKSFFKSFEKKSADNIQSKKDKAFRIVLIQTAAFYRD